MDLYSSCGILESGPNNRLVLRIDPDIVKLYYSLLPKAWYVQRSYHPAHITVCRTGVERPAVGVENFSGLRCEFFYSNIIDWDERYFWLNCWSRELEEVRSILGLTIASRLTMPPAGHMKTFHCTIGNVKRVGKG